MTTDPARSHSCSASLPSLYRDGRLGKARQTRREGERAWVNVTELSSLPTVQGRQPSARLSFANNGHTPSWDTAVSYQVEIAPQFTATDEPPEDSYKNAVVVAPGAHSHVDISLTDGLTQDRIAKFRSGEQKMYIFGVFRYSDLYKNRHFTRFCFNYDKSITSLCAMSFGQQC